MNIFIKLLVNIGLKDDEFIAINSADIAIWFIDNIVKINSYFLFFFGDSANEN